MDVCVHDMVSIQAKQTSNVRVVEAWDGKFTYAEMDGISKQLAGYLCNAYMRRGRYVNLRFSKPAWTIIASLTILKAGKVCVQPNPKWPQDRKQNTRNRIETRAILVSPEIIHSSLKLALRR